MAMFLLIHMGMVPRGAVRYGGVVAARGEGDGSEVGDANALADVSALAAGVRLRGREVCRVRADSGHRDECGPCGAPPVHAGRRT
jgi:hypothetical protein